MTIRRYIIFGFLPMVAPQHIFNAAVRAMPLEVYERLLVATPYAGATLIAVLYVRNFFHIAIRDETQPNWFHALIDNCLTLPLSLTVFVGLLYSFFCERHFVAFADAVALRHPELLLSSFIALFVRIAEIAFSCVVVSLWDVSLVHWVFSLPVACCWTWIGGLRV